MESFIDYCKNYIEGNLDDFEGCEVYLCDLGIELTEGPNCDGTLTYSRAGAMDYLREWFYDAGEYMEWEKLNFGQVEHNPFDNPEAYMVCMVIEGVRSLIAMAIDEVGLEDKWNEKVKLTKTLINKLKKSVRENEEDELF